MTWIKNVIVDVIVTVIIALYVFSNAAWGYWVIIVYTPLMVLLKLGAVASGVSKVVKQKPDETPNWFYHVLYALNFALLLYGAMWWPAAGWAAIWILSAVQASRTERTK